MPPASLVFISSASPSSWLPALCYISLYPVSMVMSQPLSLWSWWRREEKRAEAGGHVANSARVLPLHNATGMGCEAVERGKAEGPFQCL